MIAPTVIREIERLLDEGQCTHRTIARRTGVSPTTVTAVAMGERQATDYIDSLDDREELTQPRRCPTCGAMVEMPCRLCQTRELMESQHLRFPKLLADIKVGLHLKPEHQARYAEVRRWRREARRMGAIRSPGMVTDSG